LIPRERNVVNAVPIAISTRWLLGTVNAGPDDFAAALRNLDVYRNSWPEAVQTLIAGRYPPEQAAELILGRPTGIKTVIAFDS